MSCYMKPLERVSVAGMKVLKAAFSIPKKRFFNSALDGREDHMCGKTRASTAEQKRNGEKPIL